MGGPRHRPGILLVDDYRPNLTALEAILGSTEWDLITADTGEQALRAMEEDRDGAIALVILDVALPDMNGFEVAELLQHRERTRHVPVLFLTGKRTDQAAMHRGYSSGAIDYITKPFDTHALLAKVRLLVDLYEYARSLREEVERLRQVGAQAARVAHEVAAIAERPLNVALPHELPALVFVLSPSGIVDEVTGAMARFEGFGPGAQPVQFAHPDDQPALRHALAGALARGMFEVEARFREKQSGRWRWLLLRGTAERDERGEILCWLGVGADIHAQKQALDENVQLLIREQAARRAALGMLHRAELQADAAEIATTWTRPEALLSRLTRLLLERAADWCSIDLLRGGSVERVAVLHRDRVWADTAARLEVTQPLGTLAGTALWRVLTTAQPELHAGTARELAHAIVADPETVGRLGARSWAIVPLACTDYCGGALTLVCGAGHDPLVDADLRVLARIARLIAVTMKLWERDHLRREADGLRGEAVALLAGMLPGEHEPRRLARIARMIATLAQLDPAPEGEPEQEPTARALAWLALELDGVPLDAPEPSPSVPRPVVRAARVLFEPLAQSASGPIRLSLCAGHSTSVELTAEIPVASPMELARRWTAARARPVEPVAEEEDAYVLAWRFAAHVLEQLGANIDVQPLEDGIRCTVALGEPAARREGPAPDLPWPRV
ncbi:MAG: response regulator [Myxococcaceae bacterium]|nr:response regulator [Myxococcaceae bacterium]